MIPPGSDAGQIRWYSFGLRYPHHVRPWERGRWRRRRDLWKRNHCLIADKDMRKKKQKKWDVRCAFNVRCGGWVREKWTTTPLKQRTQRRQTAKRDSENYSLTF